MHFFTIAFYNTENFFDPFDNERKHDGDYTPNGSRKWTIKRYEEKVRKIGQAINLIGMEETHQPPLIVGLAEIENKKVLHDLVHSEFLDEFNYEYVHFESLDERGVDTALLFRREFLELLDKRIIRSTFPGDFTRDILYVKFKLQQYELHTFVVHLPSRRDLDINRTFRNIILNELRNEIDEILKEEPNANIVLMGDFNGEPNDEDAMQILKSKADFDLKPDEFHNPMLNLKKSSGSLMYAGDWILFDQIMFSSNFFSSKSADYQVQKVDVFKHKLLKDMKGKFAGIPFRTYAGNKYLGGYSDHFPVFAILNY